MDKTTKGIYTIYLYDRHVELLDKYNFEEEMLESIFPEEEKDPLLDLKESGFINTFFVNGKTYVQGTRIYKQYKYGKK